MTGENFDIMRKRVLRKHKHSIVRLALKGHKSKGRGLVLVKFTEKGRAGMVHLSYVTLATLKDLRISARHEDEHYGAMLIDKISAYHPDSEIPFVITDGETEQFAFGVKRVA